MFAYFQSAGTFPRVMDLLNNAVRDVARTSDHSFNNLAEIPSGPVAFDVDRLFSRRQTSSTETSENSVGVTGTVLDGGKHGFWGRGRNTEAKNLFKASALSLDDLNVESARVMVSGNVDLFDFDLI
jgi:hypothetical protein